jgi:ferredoxin
MEGNGPSAGAPIRLGFLAASPDAVALDGVLCRTLGLDPRNVAHLDLARQEGLGVKDWADIVTTGDRIAALRPRDYRLPSTVPINYVPHWLVRLVQPLIYHRPVFSSACVTCGKCVKACPAGALSMKPGKRPVLNPDTCIACCCCHEMCPEHAIEMRPSPFFRFARQFTKGRRTS